MLFSSSKSAEYPDDFFAETRMSFGDHIEELRTHLIRALLGLLVVLLGGLILDGVGLALGNSKIGVGRPMVDVIVEPLRSMLRDFYAKRNQVALEKFKQSQAVKPDPAEVRRIRDKVEAAGGSLEGLTAAEQRSLLSAPTEMPVVLPIEPFEKVFGPPKDPAVKQIEVSILVYPAQFDYLATQGELLLGSKQYVTTLSAQEAMVVYFKVALLCSFVIASPWVFFQVWSFVAAGLYPHERAYVYKFLGPSLFLFLSGVLLCQFFVLPTAVKALLSFNEWIDLDPDIRLNEWLGFALILPLVFGVSFQTPLVMFFFNRIGTFSAADYWAKWRVAVIVLAVFSALITPTADAITMLYLFVPMFGLYVVGVLVCHYFPPEHETAWKDEEQQVAV